MKLNVLSKNILKTLKFKSIFFIFLAVAYATTTDVLCMDNRRQNTKQRKPRKNKNKNRRLNAFVLTFRPIDFYARNPDGSYDEGEIDNLLGFNENDLRDTMYLLARTCTEQSKYFNIELANDCSTVKCVLRSKAKAEKLRAFITADAYFASIIESAEITIYKPTSAGRPLRDAFA